MSIVITNITRGGTNDEEPNSYVVSINGVKYMGFFTHMRKDGLAVCLRKAADAVEKMEKKDDKGG